MPWQIAPRTRVVVDNDWAGDPDGLVALAHHLLSPGNRVEAVTSSFLSPAFVDPAGSAAAGADLAAGLIEVLGGPHRPPVHAGTDHPFDGSAVPSAAARALAAAAGADDPLPLTVVCAGPLTNVAHALAADPGLARRFTLTWVGGSLRGAAEYNRDTDPAAAEFVLGLADLRVRQYPLETYRRCTWSVRQLEEFLRSVPPAGPWLWRRFTDLPLPDGFPVGPVWPLGDSCPVLDTALSPGAGDWVPGPREGVEVCTGLDTGLLFGDLRAVLGRHARSGDGTY